MGAGGLYLEGRFNRGFFALRVWGGGAFIWRGLFSEFYGKLKVNKKTEAQMHTKKREKRKKRYYYAMKEA